MSILQVYYTSFMGVDSMYIGSYNKPPIQKNETFSVDIRKISTVIWSNGHKLLH